MRDEKERACMHAAPPNHTVVSSTTLHDRRVPRRKQKKKAKRDLAIQRKHSKLSIARSLAKGHRNRQGSRVRGASVLQHTRQC
ncbi:hypothetical protein IE81DRAFT_136343 [Ceraceosorus guamensis]|uniref:Uncharacterized protein n=1 Tax=Ceraceosorus guamensis TaxID=1522189 RepID=A0A316VY57_9BASI|nr:hypothetical protein IE81DRAFT_136343 [Ceraceosorus guamensis]PWN42420.1 hypothetical protein IE81DRAFT_136343 [Ceraceosorus guamensis]